jgi:hypothetical protein
VLNPGDRLIEIGESSLFVVEADASDGVADGAGWYTGPAMKPNDTGLENVATRTMKPQDTA